MQIFISAILQVGCELNAGHALLLHKNNATST